MTPLSPKPLSADQLQRLDNLIALDSARLQALERDLQCFRDLILPRPEALRRELLGYAEEQRARLTDTQHWALEVLCTHPDYLAPLGFTREETSHTRFLTWLLGPARTTPLRDGPAKAVWGVLHRAWDQQGKDDPAVLDKNRALATPELPPDGLAQAEVDLGPPGRIDVDWTFPGAKLLIEAKVDAKPSGGRPPRYEKWLTEQNQPAANHTQLERYRTWLNLQHVKRLQRVKHRDPALVLLDLYAHTPSGDDLENDARPKTDSGGAEDHERRKGVTESHAVLVTWRDLLSALIPMCKGRTDAHQTLRAWLKSLAILEQASAPGGWEHWNVAERVHALTQAKKLTNGGGKA